jgi:CBS domain-containing protein
MNVHDFLSSPAITCPPQASLAEAASLMREYDVGCAIVVDKHGHVVGIATDRDITVRGVARSLGSDTPISEVMTPEVAWIHDEADIFEAATRMATGAFRRLPVLDTAGHVTGVVSLDDLTGLFVTEATKLAHVVSKEVAGRTKIEPTLAPRGKDAA